MINSASAVATSTSLNTVDFIEIATGYRQAITGGNSGTTSQTTKGQVLASDLTSGNALGVSSTSNTIVRISSSQVVSSVVLNGLSNDVPYAMILKAPGQWLCGTQYGMVYELDQFGNILDTFDLQYALSRGLVSSASIGGKIYNLAIDGNLLLISSSAALVLVDWSTKTIIKIYSPGADQSNTPQMFCVGASGETVMCSPTPSINGTLFEVDYTIQPIQIRDQIYLDSTSVVSIVNMSTAGPAFSIDTAGKVRFFNVTPRGTTTRTVTVQVAGVNQKARLTQLDDSVGVGNSFVTLDTYMQSPGTYRVPTGKTMMEVTKVGDGALALFDVSRYST
jgi:hypothetical protein